MKRCKKNVQLFTILIIVTISTTLLISCNQKDPCKDCPSTKTIPLSGDLYQLILTKPQYEAIATPGVAKIDFQFYFRNDSANYPTLAAYGTKNKHYERVGDSIILKTNGVVGKALPAINWLGTQEVTTSAIEGQLRTIFGGNPANWKYDHFLFIPDIDARGQIFYTIKIICLPSPCPDPHGSLTTQPSPPANAN